MNVNAQMKMYGLKSCDSCKKALKQLRIAGHEVNFCDIRKNPIDAKQLTDLLARHGTELLINRKSTTWRKLSDDDRLLPPISLLTKHPSLIKRPVIFAFGVSHIGWSVAVQKAIGL